MNDSKKVKYERIYWLFNIVVLFLYGMQFMAFPYKLSFIWLTAIIIIGIIRCKKIMIDIPSVLLSIGFVSYSFIVEKDLKSTIIFAGLPVLTYLAGKTMSASKYSFCDAETNSRTLFLALTLGTFFCGLLEKYSRFFRFTEECYSGRYWFDFWDGGIRPATYYMFYAMMTLGCLCWAVCIWKKNKIISTIFGIFIVLELLFFGWVKTRTPFCIVIAVMVSGFILFLCLNHKKSNMKKLIVIAIAIIVSIVTVLAVIWFGNLFNIQQSALGRVLTHDGGILGNARFKGQRNVLMQLFKYPMGGKQMDIAGLKYAHNVWLDIAYTAGIIPFVFVVAYTVFTFADCIKLIKSEKISAEMKYLIIGIFVALHLDYSVEPVLDANLVFWSMGTCFSGMIKGYLIRMGEE